MAELKLCVVCLSGSNKRSQKIQLTLSGNPQEEVIWHFVGVFFPEDLEDPPPEPEHELMKIKKPKILSE